jgi:MFS transporter, SP family, xylose:H+ symportor
MAVITTTEAFDRTLSLSKGRISAYLIYCAVVASLCGLLFGFETAVISGTTEWLRAHFELSNSMLGFTVATALLGSIVGAFAIGKPTDAFGRRAVLFALALMFLVAALGCALAWNLGSFIVFRFIGGLAVGGASVVAPVYIAELSPAAYRGRLVTITQLNIVGGILLAYLSNFIIGRVDLGSNEARWMFGVMAIPAVLFFFLLSFTPQSPRWLIARGRTAEARKVFERCGTDSGSIDEGIAEIQRSFALSPELVRPGPVEGSKGKHDPELVEGREPFFRRKYFKPISLAAAIAAFNQFSGINAVLYYTGYIFTSAGADKTSALLQSVIIGLTLLVFTLSALFAIDHFGRRKLMLVGSVGYILSLSAVAYSFYTGVGGWLLLASLLVFVASHAFGQGAVIWVFIGEIFPNSVRARGQALGVGIHWILAAAISWTFPVIAASSGGHAFAFYGVCMVGQLLWVLFLMPETKGVPLEQIQKRMGIS